MAQMFQFGSGFVRESISRLPVPLPRGAGASLLFSFLIDCLSVTELEGKKRYLGRLSVVFSFFRFCPCCGCAGERAG